MAVDFNYFLNRKYDILQQQANTADVNAAATTRNAATAALTGEAAAALDRVRTRLLPAESAANIGLTNAQANLTGQQASIVVPESQARIRAADAQTAYTTTQNGVLRYTGLGDESALAPPVRDAVRLQRASQPFTLGDIVPSSSSFTRLPAETPRRPGESYAAYLDRINGF